MAVTHSTPADGTFSGTGATAWDAAHTVDDNTLVAAKLSATAASKLFGRGSTGSGAGQEITLGTGLSMSGTTISSSGGASTPTFPGGIPLTGVSYPAVRDTNISTGDIDLYTVPSNKRVAVIGYYLRNDTGGNVVHYPTIKISSTYYRIGPNSTTSTGNQAGPSIGYIAEAGETIAINIATTSGAVVVFSVVEFDDSNAWYSPKLTTLSAGDNTIYTVPSAKTAILQSSSNIVSVPTAGALSTYINTSGGSRTIFWKFVPSGGSAATVTASSAIGDQARGQLNVPVGGSAGDAWVINTDAATATQFAWLNVMEI